MSHAKSLAKIDTTTRATVARIIDTFNRATPSDIEAGSIWYADGERLAESLASESNHSVETCATVIAHLSPRTTWARNVAGATALLLTGRAMVGCIGANVERARGAIASDAPLDTLNGPKTRRFALNILGDREAVTVDVWAARVALGVKGGTERALGLAGVYEALEHCYQLAARRLGLDPASVQAITWIVARNGRAS